MQVNHISSDAQKFLCPRTGYFDFLCL